MALKQALEATTTAKVEVKLEPKIRQMVKARCDEHAQLATTISESQGRQKRLRVEVEELFKKSKQGKALSAGTALADHKLKMVFGSRAVFDKIGFMKKHGLSQADFDEFTSKEDNAPYLKITSGKSGGSEDAD